MLTQKQEKFVQGLIKGLSQREAYKAAYDAANMQDNTIDSKASLLFQKDEIRARYEELRKASEEDDIYNAITMRKRIVEKLCEIAFEDEHLPDGRHAGRRDQLQAIGQLREMFALEPESKEDAGISINVPGDYAL